MGQPSPRVTTTEALTPRAWAPMQEKPLPAARRKSQHSAMESLCNPNAYIHKYKCMALFTVAKTRKQLKCPLTKEWIKKMWCLYIVEYFSARKKNEIIPFVATWMGLEMIMLSEVSQREKGQY